MAEPYNRIFDDGITITRSDGQPIYEGRAAPGYGTSEAKWQIMKYFYDANGDCIKIVHADGDAGFVHIYNNRTSLDYYFS